MCAPLMATHYKVTGQLQSMTWYTVAVQGLEVCHRDVGCITKGNFETSSKVGGGTKMWGGEKGNAEADVVIQHYKGGGSWSLNVLCDAVTSPSGQLASGDKSFTALANNMHFVQFYRWQVWVQFTWGTSFAVQLMTEVLVLCVDAVVSWSLLIIVWKYDSDAIWNSVLPQIWSAEKWWSSDWIFRLNHYVHKQQHWKRFILLLVEDRRLVK